MGQRCESCGQVVPEGEVSSTAASWIGSAEDGHQHSFAKPAGTRSSGRDKKLLVVVGGLVVVWGLFVGVGRLSAPDDAIDEQAVADLAESERERAQAAATAEARASTTATPVPAPTASAANVDGDYTAADAAPGFPVIDQGQLGSRFDVATDFERLQRQLASRGIEAIAVYRARSGLVVIDLDHGSLNVIEPALGSTALQPGIPLFRSGGSTFALDVDNGTAAPVIEHAGLLVTDTGDGNMYAVSADSIANDRPVVDAVADLDSGSYEAPTDHDLVALDGLGLVAVADRPTGPSLIAGTDSFRPLSENQVLHGNETGLVEQACETPRSCELIVTLFETGEQWLVPASFVRRGDRYQLSQNGRSLVRHSPQGFAEIYSSETGAIAWIAGSGVRNPTWGPGSEFVGWIDRIGDPTLNLMFPDQREWLSFDLESVNAPEPVSPELLILGGPEVTAERLGS